MADARKVRRGLPRVSGGDLWPPDGKAPSSAARQRDAEDGEGLSRKATGSARPMVADAGPAPASGVRSRRQGLPREPGATPAPATGPPAAATEAAPTPAAEDGASSRPDGLGLIRGRTRRRRAAIAAVAVIALAAVLAIVVIAARWFVDMIFMREFLANYPGEYQLPKGAPVGLPAWLNWSHFFSAFLIVLIVRTGLRLRNESRPPAFWTPRWNGERKISLTVWLHQSLDLLWIANGVVFLVLLFATGQWARIVPTSWQVFPNALAVALRYLSFHWPAENGWVNYNSLQQLAYFVTVFVAAPLAVITGVRLSGLWPKSAGTLNRIYPIQLARTIHSRVMLYFVAFIIVHVTLVFVTEPLRNLNHMFAARGSTDPSRYLLDWTGLFVFLAAAVVTAIGLIVTAKPLVIAPIASRFGKVSSR